MAITLDPATEQRIQRELDRGHYARRGHRPGSRPPRSRAGWLQINKSALNARLEESMAHIDRGEGIPGDQLLRSSPSDGVKPPNI